MGEGGKLISDTDDICDRYIIGGYLVTIEIEKAFDSLDHKFILAVKKKLVLAKTLFPGLRYYWIIKNHVL